LKKERAGPLNAPHLPDRLQRDKTADQALVEVLDHAGRDLEGVICSALAVEA
jgi:hypothetical protein